MEDKTWKCDDADIKVIETINSFCQHIGKQNKDTHAPNCNNKCVIEANFILNTGDDVLGNQGKSKCL